MSATLCECGCGEPSTGQHRGDAAACYYRWYRAGMPDTGPPPPSRGPAVSAAHKENIAWLAANGASCEEIAKQVSLSLQSVLRYLTADDPPAECAVDGCHQGAARYRWCQEHRDPQQVYRVARATGMNRQQAAAHVGVRRHSTYRWEPGEPGQGRPRSGRAA